MTKQMPIPLAILLSFLLIIVPLAAGAEFVRLTGEDIPSHWYSESQQHRHELIKKWFEKQPRGSPAEVRSPFSAVAAMHTTQTFQGCLDPSEPFQCPQTERCIALQFVCDGHPGDCPHNRDENEEICIAAKRPAKENIENFLRAEYVLHGSQLFKYLFGSIMASRIENDQSVWLNSLASAFSVSKNIGTFAKRLQISSDDLAHFRNVIQQVHDGRLEEIPLFAQEAVNQGLAPLIEKLYESGFMEE